MPATDKATTDKAAPAPAPAPETPAPKAPETAPEAKTAPAPEPEPPTVTVTNIFGYRLFTQAPGHEGQVIFERGQTPGIPAGFWVDWLKVHGKEPMVTNGVVSATPDKE